MIVAFAACLAVGAAAVCAAAVGAAGPAGTPRCRAADMAGAIIDRQGAAGSRFARLVLVNTSSRTCRTRGFIGGTLIGIDDRPLTTHVVHTHGTAARTVIVKPGAAAALSIRWSVIPRGSAPCRLARWLMVALPGATSTVRVYFRDTACRGEIDVRPLTDPATVR
jgi:hypothetical protein